MRKINCQDSMKVIEKRREEELVKERREGELIILVES
tara:strand:+ start:25 stop:135 length:111 start_codon:yes stop_codon:yes gene_type:complete